MRKVLLIHQEKITEKQKQKMCTYYGIGKDEEGKLYVTYVDAFLRQDAEHEIELWCAKHGLRLEYVGVLKSGGVV